MGHLGRSVDVTGSVKGLPPVGAIFGLGPGPVRAPAGFCPLGPGLRFRPGSAGPAGFDFRGRLALARSTDRRASLHEGEHGRCFAVTGYEFGKVGVNVKGIPERRTM